MADIVKSKNTLSVENEFADGDTRTINLENPNTAINLAAAVKNIGAFAKTNQVILGDKTGAAFTRIKSAKLTNRQTTYLDLTL